MSNCAEWWQSLMCCCKSVWKFHFWHCKLIFEFTKNYNVSGLCDSLFAQNQCINCICWYYYLPYIFWLKKIVVRMQYCQIVFEGSSNFFHFMVNCRSEKSRTFRWFLLFDWAGILLAKNPLRMLLRYLLRHSVLNSWSNVSVVFEWLLGSRKS